MVVAMSGHGRDPHHHTISLPASQRVATHMISMVPLSKLSSTYTLSSSLCSQRVK